MNANNLMCIFPRFPPGLHNYTEHFYKQSYQKMGRRLKHTFLQKRHNIGPISTWKDAQRHYFLDKCKRQLQQGTSSHQSEGPSRKSLQTEAPLVAKQSGLCTSNEGNVNSIPDQGTRSQMPQLRVCMLQLKIPGVATKTRQNQINK